MNRRILLLCLLFLLDAGGCATIRKFNPINSHTLEARRLTQEAEAAIHQASWEEAEEKLVSAIERCPEDNHSRAVLADVLWQRGAQRAAIEQKARSITLSGRRDAFELTELGQMELTAGDLRNALLHADEAIAQNSSHADAWALRGFVLQATNKPEEALSAFFRSLSINNEDPRTRLEIAKIYRATGRPQRALAVLGAAPREVVTACPDYSEVCYLRGVLMQQLGRSVDAIAALQSAKELGFPADDLLLHLAEAQLAAGEQLQARATLAEAKNLDAYSLEANSDLRLAFRQLEDRVEQGASPTVWR